MEQELDQSLYYSAPHARTPEQTKKIRRKIVMVTLLLSAITIFEVVIGILYSKTHVGAESSTWQAIKMMYIVLTLIKAGYIVIVFMHLGDERKNLRTTILLPIVLLVYLIFICLFEGEYLLQYVRDILN
jgi:cytochrome c oxidase subunit IV